MPLKNQVFSSLVEDEEDALGMIAYSFYKLHKREFCENFEKNHKREPSADDWDQFALAMTDAQLENYKQRASNVIAIFLEDNANSVILEEINKAKEDYRNKLDSYLQSHNKALIDLEIISKTSQQISEQIKPKSFWYGVSQGVMASVLFVFLIGVLAFLLRVLKVDVIGIARAIGEWAGTVSAP